MANTNAWCRKICTGCVWGNLPRQDKDVVAVPNQRQDLYFGDFCRKLPAVWQNADQTGGGRNIACASLAHMEKFGSCGRQLLRVRNPPSKEQMKVDLTSFSQIMWICSLLDLVSGGIAYGYFGAVAILVHLPSCMICIPSVLQNFSGLIWISFFNLSCNAVRFSLCHWSNLNICAAALLLKPEPLHKQFLLWLCLPPSGRTSSLCGDVEK